MELSLVDVEEINPNLALKSVIRSIEADDAIDSGNEDIDPIFLFPSPISNIDFCKIVAKKSVNGFIAGVSFGLGVALVDRYWHNA